MVIIYCTRGEIEFFEKNKDFFTSVVVNDNLGAQIHPYKNP